MFNLETWGSKLQSHVDVYINYNKEALDKSVAALQPLLVTLTTARIECAASAVAAAEKKLRKDEALFAVVYDSIKSFSPVELTTVQQSVKNILYEAKMRQLNWGLWSLSSNANAANPLKGKEVRKGLYQLWEHGLLAEQTINTDFVDLEVLEKTVKLLKMDHKKLKQLTSVELSPGAYDDEDEDEDPATETHGGKGGEAGSSSAAAQGAGRGRGATRGAGAARGGGAKRTAAAATGKASAECSYIPFATKTESRFL